jgi:hypothetical protein
VVQADGVPTQPPPSPDVKFAGTVSLLTVISDKGYVCSVQLLHGFDKDADGKAEQSVRQGHFGIARKNGRPVPVVVEIKVHFWRNASGELIQGAPSQSNK